MLTVNNSTISGNSTGGVGGGIDVVAGSCTVSNSTLNANTAASTTSGEGGGGISNSGTLTVTNSTFSANVATTADGGGIDNRRPGHGVL